MIANNQEDVILDGSEIAKTLEILRDEFCENGKLTNNSMEEFKKVAIMLSSALPDVSDESLFEIDDLLYSKDDKTETNKPKIFSEERSRNLFQSCFIAYHIIYTRLVYPQCNSCYENRLFHRTYLQFLQCVPDETTELSKSTGYYIKRFITSLIWARNESKLVLALKILKIALGKKREFMIKYINNRDYIHYLWLTNLPNIPQAKHPDKKIITSWLAKQSKHLFETFNINLLPICYDVKLYLEAYKAANDRATKQFIILFMQTLFAEPMSIHEDHLYLYFMSAQDEKQKIERLKNFLRGMAKYWDASVVQTEISRIVWTFHTNLRYMMESNRYTKEHLTDIEKYNKYEIKPYLPDNPHNSLIWRPSVRQLINEKLSDGKPSENENEATNEPDYTIEKFLFYDNFMKRLHVLNIIHTACLMSEELMEKEGIEESIEGYDTGTFRNIYDPIMKYLNEILNNPSKRGKTPWWIEITLKHCPFMFLPNRLDYLMEDLIKLLKGEFLSEVSEERIYFAINNSRLEEERK